MIYATGFTQLTLVLYSCVLEITEGMLLYQRTGLTFSSIFEHCLARLIDS